MYVRTWLHSFINIMGVHYWLIHSREVSGPTHTIESFPAKMRTSHLSIIYTVEPLQRYLHSAQVKAW